MLCCFRPSAKEQDGQHKATASSTASAIKHNSPAQERLPSSQPAPKVASGRRSNSLGNRPGAGPQPQPEISPQHQPSAQVKPGSLAATHAAGPAGQDQGQVAGSGPGDDTLAGQQGGVLQLVALLQELLALSTASPRQPLSKAMALLVLRLPVDWACLHAISLSAQVVLQVSKGMLDSTSPGDSSRLFKITAIVPVRSHRVTAE